jgi:hypothetical protein
MLALSLAGWYVGYAIAAIVIAIVVVLVAIILGLARRIGVQADMVTDSLDESRVNTFPMWDVDKVNDALRGARRNAEQARTLLEGGR